MPTRPLSDGEPYIGPCFRQERADPATCRHPVEAQFCNTWDDPVLMFGKRPASEDEQPTAESCWAPAHRRGRAGEYWLTTNAWMTVVCFACNTQISERIAHRYVEELPPETLAKRWGISLEEAKQAHRPPPGAKRLKK